MSPGEDMGYDAMGVEGGLTARARAAVEQSERSFLGFIPRRLSREISELLDDIARGLEAGSLDAVEALIVAGGAPREGAWVELEEREKLERFHPAWGLAPERLLALRERGEDRLASWVDAFIVTLPDHDVVTGALRVVAGQDRELAEVALFEITKLGADGLEELRAMGADPEVGALAMSCHDAIERRLLPEPGYMQSPQTRQLLSTAQTQATTIAQLVDSFREAATADDADYALTELAILLKHDGGVCGEDAREVLEELIVGLGDEYLAAEAEDEEAALEGLQAVVETCGPWLGESVHELLEGLPVAVEIGSPADEGARKNHARSRAHPDAERREDRVLTAAWREDHPLLARLLFSTVDLTLAPGWVTPEGIEPGSWEDCLANDVIDDLKQEMADSLIDMPDEVPSLRLLTSHPVAGPWVREILRRDEEIAATEGLTLDGWASLDPPPLVKALATGSALDDDGEVEVGDGHPADSVTSPEPASAPERASAPEPASVPEQASESEPANAAGTAHASEPGEPPTVDEMKRGFEEFMRRIDGS